MRLPTKNDLHEEFVFEVRDPAVSYHFTLQHERRASDPYNEMLSVNFLAECIYPQRCSGRVAQAGFHADVKLERGSDHRKRLHPDLVAVGSIRIGKDRFEVGGFLPPAVCWRLGAAIADGTVNAMLASGRFPTKGHGFLGSVSFHGRDFDPYDYVGIPRPPARSVSFGETQDPNKLQLPP